MAEVIGLSNLPTQRARIVTQDGGVFNMMVCGESGLGKTTFVNTLFSTTLKSTEDHPRDNAIRKTVRINISRAILEESDFSLRVNVIDTPGFGDNINNDKAWQTVVDFIDDQHDSYMRQEQQPFRDTKFDLRIHAVLYFIRPTGHGLKPIDIETMKRLSSRANLIPIISKSDTLTQNEITEFKNRVRQVLEYHQIRIFTPPLEETADQSNKQDMISFEHARSIIEAMPFHIVGSDKQYQNAAGQMVTARKYPWGLVEVENEAHCNFVLLRTLLLRTYLADLIETTNEIHYETYRRLRLEVGLKEGEDQRDDDPFIPARAPARKLSHNPAYKQEENALKKYFTDQVKAEEQRFRQWEQNIVTERSKLNSDLEEIQQKVKKMEDQVKNLQLKMR